MKLFYGIMATDKADYLRFICGGDGAAYNDNKLTLVGITEDQIKGFEGEVIRLDHLSEELPYHELSSMVDSMLAAKETGKLIIASKTQGGELHGTHPAFTTPVDII